MVSVDDAETNKKFATEHDADFPILSDPEKGIANVYGVLGTTGLARRWTFYIGQDGKILHIEPKTLIVQTWRSGNWPFTAMDSVLMLSFWPAQDGARIELVHDNVPEEDFAGVSQGWEKYYWTPWHDYLIGKTHAS